jgi:hypothetical protein
LDSEGEDAHATAGGTPALHVVSTEKELFRIFSVFLW